MTLSAAKNSFRLISVFRPPSSGKNKPPINKFFLHFSDLIGRIFTLNVKIFLAGDFNVHVDIPSDFEAILFNDILTTLNLQQHVKGPTHRCDHTLDLVIARERDNNILSQTKVLREVERKYKKLLDYLFPRYAQRKTNKIYILRKTLQHLMGFKNETIKSCQTNLSYFNTYSNIDISELVNSSSNK